MLKKTKILIYFFQIIMYQILSLIQSINVNINSTISLFFSLILIYCILSQRNNKRIINFNIVIITSCIGDALLSFMHIISNIEIIYTDHYSYYTINGVLGKFSLTSKNIFFVIFIFTYCQYFCYFSLSISLFYKFMFLCKNEKYNRKLLFQYIILIILIALLLSVIKIFILYAATKEPHENINKYYLNEQQKINTNTLSFNRKHYGFIIQEIFVLIFIIISFFTIIIFGILVTKKLNKKNIKKSGKTVDLRNKMKSVILMQMISAFIFTIIPVFLTSLYFFTSLYFSSLGHIILIMTSYLPLSNIIIHIFFTYDYKYRVLQLIFPNKHINKRKRYKAITEIFKFFFLATNVCYSNQDGKLSYQKRKTRKLLHVKSNGFVQSEYSSYL
uniref:G_PROTEIN_RECEP_F1_2 domain-containing protein n=1 Tax=Strongyloides stercoralis TaxID=6248 RepID=A0A0K0DXV8_STRER